MIGNVLKCIRDIWDILKSFNIYVIGCLVGEEIEIGGR